VTLTSSDVGLGCANVMNSGVPELIDLAGRHGFRKISGRPYMYLQALAEGFTEKDIHRKLTDARVQVGILDGLIRSLPGLRPLEAMDPALVAAMPPDITDGPDEDTCLRIAEILGAPIVNVGGVLNGPVSIDEVAEAVAILCRKADRRGLRIALEPIPFTVLPDLPFTQAVIESCGESNCGIMIDVFHMDRFGGTIDDIQALPPGTVAAMQLSDRLPPVTASGLPIDRRRLMPGEGSLPLHEIVEAVLDNNPQAYIEVEVLNNELSALPADEVVSRLAAAVRSWIESG
jgi:sugar phosphate isomerase/epimerase